MEIYDRDVAEMWDALVDGGWTPPQEPSNAIYKTLRLICARKVRESIPDDPDIEEGHVP
jgi:hypothetical protein